MRKRGFTLVVLVAVVSLCAGGLLSASPVFASGDVNEGVCSNEGYMGFSVELPDCRAYEQVSPVYKGGFNLAFDYVLLGGDRVQAESFGLFAGATSYPFLSPDQYQLVRSESGWVTQALSDIPLGEFAYTDAISISLNSNGASLMQLHPASGSVFERDLYIHEPDGSFVEVGPMLPESAVPPIPTGSGEPAGKQPKTDFVDATSDLTHVLFTLDATPDTGTPGVTTDLWPGDTTHLSASGIVSSLYEYDHAGSSTPALVGVDDDGRLISDCGTAPGGWSEQGEGNHLNVISERGARVFFTSIGAGSPFNPACVGAAVVPRVDELFVREGGSSTVAISEPNAVAPAVADEGCTSSGCREDITEPEDFRDANFEKASRDGSKVFFSSTQRLVNDATQDGEPEDSAVPRGEEKGCQRTTPGANGCNLYEYDFSENPATGKPVGLVLVSGVDTSGVGPEVQGVAGVSEDGSHVYFVAKGVLTREPRASASGECIDSLSPAELALEEATLEGKCRPKRGQDNLYVYNTTAPGASPEFVATLSESDAGQWSFNAAEGQMNVTDDGAFLVFTSSEHLVEGDASTVQQVFRYEAGTGALVRVSLGDEGSDGLGGSGVSSRKSTTTGNPEPLEGDAHPAVSQDGQIVVFNSTEALTPEAVNNECVAQSKASCAGYAYNVYEYRDGHLALISHGAATSEAPVISASGRDIFFQTPERLTAQDTDTLTDIYDAREDGGFAAAVSQAPCGSACQGPFPAAPVFAAPGTASVGAGGELARPTPAAPKPKSRTSTRARKLANALRICRRKRSRSLRTSCEKGAHRRYGPKPRAEKASSNRRPER